MAKLGAATGAVRWSKAYRGIAPNGTPSLGARDLAITSSDRIMLTGQFIKDADFGRGVITGSNYGTAFLTRFYQ
jgi:hypothetical protein